MRAIMLIILLGAPAAAKNVVVPVTNATDRSVEHIEAGINAAGYKVISFRCRASPSDCSVELPDNSPVGLAELSPIFTGAPTRTSIAAAETSSRDELAAIEAKIDDGTATAADVRRAVKLLLKLLRLNRRP